MLTYTYMYVYITVETEAQKAGIVALDDTHFSISVTEPAKRGEANKAIVYILTKHYGEKGIKVRVRFVHGATSKKKVFDVTYTK